MKLPDPASMRHYAHRKGRQRALRTAVLAPVAMLHCVPKEAFVSPHLPPDPLRMVARIVSVGVDCIGEFQGLRNGDPILLCGMILQEERGDFYTEYGKKLTDQRLAFTFGYKLKIDVKWAIRIAEDGSLKEVPDLVGSEKTVQSTRHVCRSAKPGEELVLLCNPAGTALAVESELPDPALVNALRDALADGSADQSTASPDDRHDN